MSRDEASRPVIPPVLSQFAIDHAVVGTTWLRPDGSPLYVNNALCRLLGYSRDELLMLTIRDYTPALADAWASHWAELKRRTSLTFHTRMRRRLGEATYVEVSDHYVSFAGQEYGCVFVRETAEQGSGPNLSLDIGKHRHPGDTAYLYAALVEASSEFIGIADVSGETIYLNPAGCRLLGIEPHQVRGKTVREFVMPGDDWEQVEREIWPAMFTEGFWKGEARLRHFVTGLPVPVAQYVCAINHPLTGKPIAIANISHDITERKRAEQALRESEQRLARLIDSLPGAAYRCKNDANWTTEMVSDGILPLTGYRPDELMAGSINFAQLVHADDYPNVVEAIERALQAGQSYELVYRITARDGTTKWVWERGQGVYADGGEPVALEGFLTDITARKQAEQALRDSEQRLRTIVEAEPECVKLLTPEGVLVQMNAAGLAMIEADVAAQVAGQSIYPLIVPEHRDAFRTLMERALAGERGSLQFEMIGLKGTRRWLETYATPIDDSVDHRRYVLGIARDITERKRVEDKLSYLAHHDVLTDLPNRALLNDRLNQAMIEARRHGRLVGVMLLDLDRFKTINDTLGHQAGDLLLQQVSARLRACVRQGDTVARLSGDEFAIVLMDLGDIDDSARSAQKVLAAFADPFHVVNRELHVTPSIGITLYPVDGSAIDQLLRNADAAMYRAKAAGRNNYQFYTEEMTRQAFELLSLENELRRAVDRGEFLIEYQPIVECRTGRIATVEALVRWRHPHRGLLQPSEFIPLAEETGLIVPLGEWVLFSVCAQLARWHSRGIRDVQATINLSARQFQRNKLFDMVVRATDGAGIAPASLELEITESILAEGDDVAAMLRQLSEMGVQFSVDDFGTGYSSLSYLKRFPIDRLKIDQSFVRDIPGDAEDTAIANAIIAMAHGLGMKVVAEGVETEAQMQFLRSQGCDFMQGFYLSRPLAANDMARLLQHPNPFNR